MKILFVSALLPYPPYQGGQVRMYNLLKQLGKSHDITLLSFIRSDEEKKFLPKLDFCKHVGVVLRGHAWQSRYLIKTLFSTKPFLYVTYDSDKMREKISVELSKEDYDLVHLEPSYVWPSLPRVTIHIVVAEHNIESTVYTGFTRRFRIWVLRPILYWDVLKLWFWERLVWKKATHIVTVSEQDATVVGNVVTPSKVSVISNGVDVGQFRFQLRKNPKDKVALFVGYFGWLQNRDALSYLLDSLWPAISKKYPDLQLNVVGKNLPESLQKKVSAIKGTYKSQVDDIAAEYYNADLLLAPIRVGGGTRYKILEAMATGLPVVTTTTGASGLTVSDKKELLVADNALGTVSAIEQIFSNESFRLTMTKQARKLIEDKYSWDTIAQKLENVWESVTRD